MLGLPQEEPRGASLGLIVGSEGAHRKIHLHSKQNGSGVSRCFFAICIYPFTGLRAGYGGHFSTVAEAQRSVGPGGGLEVWGGGLWSAAEGRQQAPGAAEETDDVCGPTASGADNLFVIADGYTNQVRCREDLVRHGYLSAATS